MISAQRKLGLVWAIVHEERQRRERERDWPWEEGW
jgi:hypothetical protein